MRFRYTKRKKDKLFANSGDPDQTPHFAASDLRLHCLTIARLGVSSLGLNTFPHDVSIYCVRKVWFGLKSGGDGSLICQ